MNSHKSIEEKIYISGFLNGQNTSIDIFPKKTYKWPTGTWKRYSALLITREMKMKTTMRYHLTPVRMPINKKTWDNKCWWEYAEKRNLGIAGRNVNWCSHCGKQYGGSSKDKIGTSVWSEISLLVIYPKENKSVSHRDICISFSLQHYS